MLKPLRLRKPVIRLADAVRNFLRGAFPKLFGRDDTDGDIFGLFVENPGDDPDRDPFLYSLENLTPDQIAPPVPKKKLSTGDMIYEGARLVLLLACSCVFIYSLYTIAGNIIAYKHAEDMYGQLSNSFMSDDIYTLDESAAYPASPISRESFATPDFASSLTISDNLSSAIGEAKVAVYNKRVELMKSNLNSLIIRNPDTFGWIKVDGTVVDYPVMLGTDNSYYLDHAYDKSSLPAGAIFVDYRCSRELSESFNLIMYGHNMKNGLMFNGLTNYLNRDFFFGNHKIEVSTPDGIFIYQVFAIYETRYDYDYIRTGFGGYDEFIPYVRELEKNSIYHLDNFTVNDGDRILTLSTCTNGAWTGRYAVHAKLVGHEG